MSKKGRPRTKPASVYKAEDSKALIRAMKDNRIVLNENNEPTEKSKKILVHVQLGAMPKVDMTDEKQVAQRTAEYFEICCKYSINPTIAGYSLALGISRIETYRVQAGQRVKNREVTEIVQRAYSTISAYAEEEMMDGKINPVAGIFLMRNNMGYTNNDNPVVTNDDPLGEIRTADSIMSKYKDIED